MDRAVPMTVRTADSMSVQFMSGIFCSASSRTCFMVTLPTFVLLGSFEPAPGFLLVASPAAFLSRTLVGGVFSKMLKLRSEYTVRTTGMIMSLPCVFALNSLQNAMMLMPCGPSAGPTGGAGLALPATSWSLTRPATFLAMFDSDPLLYLGEIQLDRRSAAENRHLHAELLLVGFDLFHRAREVRECAVDDADLVASFEGDARLWLHRTLDDALSQVVDLRRRDLLWALIADESGDLRRVLDEVPQLLAHLHLDEDVAREARLLAHTSLAAGALLGDRFRGDEDLAEAVLHVMLLDALEHRLFDLGLVA